MTTLPRLFYDLRTTQHPFELYDFPSGNRLGGDRPDERAFVEHWSMLFGESLLHHPDGDPRMNCHVRCWRDNNDNRDTVAVVPVYKMAFRTLIIRLYTHMFPIKDTEQVFADLFDLQLRQM